MTPILPVSSSHDASQTLVAIVGGAKVSTRLGVLDALLEKVDQLIVGGPLTDNKGINRQGVGLSAQAITDKDRPDIRTAADQYTNAPAAA